MSDRAIDKPAIESAFGALGGRFAVLAATLTALVSLWCEVPLRVAVLRGALAWVLVSVLARAGLVVLCRAIELDQRSRTGEKQP